MRPVGALRSQPTRALSVGQSVEWAWKVQISREDPPRAPQWGEMSSVGWASEAV